MKKRYPILLLVISAWIISATLVIFPNLGSPTPTFPPRDLPYKLDTLIISASIAAIYSMYLGMRHLFTSFSNVN